MREIKFRGMGAKGIMNKNKKWLGFLSMILGAIIFAFIGMSLFRATPIPESKTYTNYNPVPEVSQERLGEWRELAQKYMKLHQEQVVKNETLYGKNITLRVNNDVLEVRVKRVERIPVYSSGWRYSYASWYGPGFYGNRTASGTRYTEESWGFAHKTMKFGTKVEFTVNGITAIAPCIDRGPYVSNRNFDFSNAMAKHFGVSGVFKVKWRVVN